ncbi:MAG TPA: lipopolysaccharide heptosyltransferase II [Xanthobacteraceae bacterium]|nr:lipopolysaccharide heptosyltransferase II [Xanthobacteraceae bacterium]
MNLNSPLSSFGPVDDRDTRPLLIVPYNWIGDFVRGHTVVRIVKQRWPNRPVDILVTPLCQPLVDYMPGVRAGIVHDLPRSQLAFDKQFALAKRLRAENYGTALVMPRTWKSAIAPALADIPERVGFVGEFRFGLINQWRWGERALPRFIDKNAVLALPASAPRPENWPAPQMAVPDEEIAAWRSANGVGSRPTVALAPGSVGAHKRWPYYGELAKALVAEGCEVWVVGGPGEAEAAAQIVAAGGEMVRDLTGTDLRNGILALAAADLAVSNDSGLLHVAAAIGTPTIAVFGPTSPWHWAPLNPLAGVVQPPDLRGKEMPYHSIAATTDPSYIAAVPAADVIEIARSALATLAAAD